MRSKKNYYERERSEFDDLRHGYACFTELARLGAIASLTGTDAQAMHRLSHAYHMRFLAPYEAPTLRAVRRSLDGPEFTKESLLSAYGTLITPDKLAYAKVGIERILAGQGEVPNPLEHELTPTPSTPRLGNMLIRLHDLGLQSEYDRTIRTVYAHPEISSQMTGRKGEKRSWLYESEKDPTYYPEGLKEISSNPQKHLEILDEVAEAMLELLANGGIVITHWEGKKEVAEIVDAAMWQEHGNEIAQFLDIDFATRPVNECLTNDPAIAEICEKVGIKLPESMSHIFFVAPAVDHMLMGHAVYEESIYHGFTFGKGGDMNYGVSELIKALTNFWQSTVEKRLTELGITAPALMTVRTQPMITTDRDKHGNKKTLLTYPVITVYNRQIPFVRNPFVEAVLQDIAQMNTPVIPDAPKAKVDSRTRVLRWFRRKTGIN